MVGVYLVKDRDTCRTARNEKDLTMPLLELFHYFETYRIKPMTYKKYPQKVQEILKNNATIKALVNYGPQKIEAVFMCSYGLKHDYQIYVCIKSYLKDKFGIDLIDISHCMEQNSEKQINGHNSRDGANTSGNTYQIFGDINGNIGVFGTNNAGGVVNMRLKKKVSD